MGELDGQVCSWEDGEKKSLILLLRISQVVLALRTAVFWEIKLFGYEDL